MLGRRHVLEHQHLRSFFSFPVIFRSRAVTFKSVQYLNHVCYLALYLCSPGLTSHIEHKVSHVQNYGVEYYRLCYLRFYLSSPGLPATPGHLLAPRQWKAKTHNCTSPPLTHFTGLLGRGGDTTMRWRESKEGEGKREGSVVVQWSVVMMVRRDE